jgi:hypothetical protein
LYFFGTFFGAVEFFADFDGSGLGLGSGLGVGSRESLQEGVSPNSANRSCLSLYVTRLDLSMSPSGCLKESVDRKARFWRLLFFSLFWLFFLFFPTSNASVGSFGPIGSFGSVFFIVFKLVSFFFLVSLADRLLWKPAGRDGGGQVWCPIRQQWRTPASLNLHHRHGGMPCSAQKYVFCSRVLGVLVKGKGSVRLSPPHPPPPPVPGKKSPPKRHAEACMTACPPPHEHIPCMSGRWWWVRCCL